MLESIDERLGKTEDRLEKGDTIFKAVADSLQKIEMAVCGNESLGIPGLVQLHSRVQSLERSRYWQMGAAAAIGFIVGNLETFSKLLTK